MAERKFIEQRLHLRDGDVRVTEPEPGRWVVSWRPHRSDHPDYPGVTIDSATEAMPVEDGPDAIVEWARERFEGRDPRELAEVSLDVEATEEEVAAVEAAFEEAGLPAVATASFERKSAGDLLPWAVYVKVGAGAFATAFLGAAGLDAWRGLKVLVTRIFEARRKATDRDGSIRLDVGDRTVILSDRVSDNGFRQVAHDELPPGGYYTWDEAEGVWRRFPPT